MRTTVTIEDDLVTELFSRTGENNLGKAVRLFVSGQLQRLRVREYLETLTPEQLSRGLEEALEKDVR